MARRGRPPDPWWSDRQGGGFFFSHQGKQIKLTDGPNDKQEEGPNYLEAKLKLHRILRAESTLGSDGLPLWSLRDQYREHLQRSKPQMVEEFTKWTKSFFALHGEQMVKDIQPIDVENWLHGQTTWGPTSKNNAVRRLLACLNWGARKGVTYSNPIKGRVEIPQSSVRGKECRLPEPLCQLMIDSIEDDAYRFFIQVLYETGARPIELRMADIRHYRGGRIVHPWNVRPGDYKWKNAKTRKDRLIYLLPGTAAELERRIAGRADGPLFPSRRGKRFAETLIINKWADVRRLPKVAAYLTEHGINPRDASMYALRHTAVSRMLDRGLWAMQVAAMTGTSVQMIERTYGHPDTDRLHEAYVSVMGTPPR